jgi:thiamine-phosphate pyrophosphorylase
MKGDFTPRGYYFITDRLLSQKGNTDDVKNANAAGIELIQYREKRSSSRSLCEEAARLKALCTKSLFIVNDRLDVALAVSADGVHLGGEDMPLPAARRLLGKKRFIGVSVRTLAEARSALEEGADYLGVGPVFSTATKADAGPACGVALVAMIKKEIKLPLAAIGGINLANARSVVEAGADMICAIRAVVAAEDAGRAMRQFKEIFV